MSKLTVGLSIIAALSIGLVTPSYAQTSSPAAAGAHSTGTSLTPVWDASLGYQLLHVPDQTFPFGLNVDGARNFGPWALAAEMGWAYDKSDNVSYHMFNVGAGPRWTGAIDRLDLAIRTGARWVRPCSSQYGRLGTGLQ